MPEQMYALNCLINTIQPYGIVDQFEALPAKLDNEQFAEMPLFNASKLHN